MVFRKNSLLFLESQIIFILLSMSSLFIIPVLDISIWILCFIPLFVLTLINPMFYREYIKIDEQGIKCFNSKNTLWEYEWSSIPDIRRGSRYSLPTVELYTEKVDSIVYQLPANYFQLGKSAKEALAFYGVTIK